MPPTRGISFPVHRHTLDNGLRVVLAPDRSAPVAAVAVFYDVGFRSEPQGRTGFAHLFEHMMFQGSENVPKGDFDRLLLGNGGILNGSTTPDYTNYFEVLPSAALEMALFLEADRMRSLQVTGENLDNQIAVVKEEIRMNVLNRAYGKFPWILLPEVLFDTFANTHDGYGSFVDLEAATLEDTQSFFNDYYAPANAALVVSGHLDVDETLGIIDRYFGVIERRTPPPRVSFSEPPLAEERRATSPDPLAPTPALAIGYRAPDPLADLSGLMACDVLAHVLCDGRASRLQRRLVRDDGLVTSVDCWVGEWPGTESALQMRDPTRVQVAAFYPNPADREAILAAIDEEIAAVATGISPAEVERVVNRVSAAHSRHVDSVLQRALLMGPLELQRARPELVGEVPRLLASVSAEDVAHAAATWLRPDRRAVLDVTPGAPS